MRHLSVLRQKFGFVKLAYECSREFFQLSSLREVGIQCNLLRRALHFKEIFLNHCSKST